MFSPTIGSSLPRQLSVRLLVILTIVELAAPASLASEPQIETTLRRVGRFQRAAKLIVVDEQIYLFDVSRSDSPCALYTPNGRGSIVTSASGRIYVALSPSIWEIGLDEQVKLIANLPRPDAELGPGAFGDFFAVNAEKGEFYFTLHRKIRPSSICRLEIKTGRISELFCGESIPSDPGAPSIGMLGSGVRIDANLKTRSVFVPFKRTIVVRSFQERLMQDVQLQEPFDACRLAPDGKRLLLCREFEHPVAIVNLADWSVAYMPISGADAAWGGDDVIYYTEPTTNSLCRYRLADRLPERLISFADSEGKSRETKLMLGRSNRGAARITRAPIISRDGTWLAWGISGAQYSNDRGNPHIIVVDLANLDYRIIDADWESIYWLEP